MHCKKVQEQTLNNGEKVQYLTRLIHAFDFLTPSSLSVLPSHDQADHAPETTFNTLLRIWILDGVNYC